MKNTIKALITTAILASSLVGGTLRAIAEPATTFTRDRVVFKSVEINASKQQYATVAEIIRETFDSSQKGLLGDYPIIKREVIRQYPEPLVIWQKTLASTDPDAAYTPQRRSEAVSTRLTNLAAALGIETLEEMYQAGVFNSEAVIFAADKPDGVTLNNVVFTLVPDNRDNGDDIVNRLKDYGKGTANDAPIYN
jgi:hypothetical protein